MCTSHSVCCSSSEIVQEQVCGNFGPTQGPVIVWSANNSEYVSGTFEINNPLSSTGSVIIDVTSTPDILPYVVLPGVPLSMSVKQPTSFSIDVGTATTSGTYCITLYRRVVV
ncbi:S-Ena type endospore appendage [Bacillus cereus]|uniref:S-Ena type endospore appendage n=1 Tax=Bacillus cereus TaxID=1396 RepID=UPI000BF86BC8|nr:S-Ena type endospore appendage [Bacillus cereus]PEQ68079.1 hypothetical protein CN469_04355 [Bacillus cereus]